MENYICKSEENYLDNVWDSEIHELSYTRYGFPVVIISSIPHKLRSCYNTIHSTAKRQTIRRCEICIDSFLRN
jgi:hypothetical protein